MCHIWALSRCSLLHDKVLYKYTLLYITPQREFNDNIWWRDNNHEASSQPCVKTKGCPTVHTGLPLHRLPLWWRNLNVSWPQLSMLEQPNNTVDSMIQKTIDGEQTINFWEKNILSSPVFNNDNNIYTLLTFGSCAFTFSAPRVWNSLSVSIHESQSLSTFRRHLKTFYFQSTYPLSAAHLA